LKIKQLFFSAAAAAADQLVFDFEPPRSLAGKTSFFGSTGFEIPRRAKSTGQPFPQHSQKAKLATATFLTRQKKWPKIYFSKIVAPENTWKLRTEKN
jgi:hypothetical protein